MNPSWQFDCLVRECAFELTPQRFPGNCSYSFYQQFGIVLVQPNQSSKFYKQGATSPTNFRHTNKHTFSLNSFFYPYSLTVWLSFPPISLSHYAIDTLTSVNVKTAFGDSGSAWQFYTVAGFLNPMGKPQPSHASLQTPNPTPLVVISLFGVKFGGA